MRWFEYKTEVDALHASDELKARLRAMKQDPAAARKSTRRAAKPALVFPGWKKLGGMAACFAAGVLTVTVAGSGVLFGGLAMGSDSATAAATNPGAQNSAQKSESVRDYYGAIADDMMDGSTLYSAEMEAVMDVMNGAATPAQTKGEPDEAKAVNDNQRTGESETARKIIYTADLALETTEYDTTLAALAEALQAAGGYVEHSENMNYGTTSRRIHYVLRVPVEQYRSFLTAAEGTGSLTDKTEDSQDITAQYVDVAARIDTLQQQRTRLQQLSAQAETLYDLLEIEEKLSAVQYQLESYQRQLAVFDDQVDYCTVTVTVREVTVYTPVQPTALQRMQNALTRGFDDFADTLFDMVLWFLCNLSWLAVLAIAAVIGRQVWKKRRTARGE